jgi:hypothetical protein
MLAMSVDEGNFGSTSLKGAKWAACYHWDGPLHLGNGTVQPVLDEKTNPKQREALLTILSGKAGNAWFEVLAAVVSAVLEPIIAPIHFEFDLEKRKANVRIPGVLETVSEPIKNVVTGDSHRIRVKMPAGMEYDEPEIASAVINRGLGKIKYDWPNSHSSLAYVEHTQAGLVHRAAASR